MKLWLRIFLSILVVSLTALSASSAYLINKSHLANIAREQSRSLNEYDYIRTSVSNGIDLSNATMDMVRLLMDRYGSYYLERGIRLTLLQDGHILYDNSGMNQTAYQELLTVHADAKIIRVLENGEQHNLLVSGVFSEESHILLLCTRDITPVYLARSSNIRMALLLSMVLILFLGSLSYLYSRWITKPVHILSQGAAAISSGDYFVRIPEHKDEFKDVSVAFNHMASAVEERTTELVDKAKELQDFIDALSHEMNTPMTSIQGYAEFLQNANASEKQKQQAADHIRLQSARIKDIFTKLMTLTLTKEQPPEYSTFQINGLIREVLENFKPQMKEHHINIIQDDRLTNLWADRILIYMLLSNLVKNSIQALPKGGTIRLCSYEEDGNSVLEVADNGIGIPKDKITFLTQPFYRVDKSRSRKTGGAGLGLSICQNIVKLHHADLIIWSEEGVGTSTKIIFSNRNVTE